MTRTAAPITVTRTAAPITITSPAQTVTLTSPTKTVTVTSTVTSTVTPPPTTTTPATPVVKDFSGNGSLTEPPFTTSIGETLSWTWVNGNGDFPTGMFINDDSQYKVLVDSMATSGSTYLAPGTHTLDIITIGTWTIHIGP